MQCGEQNLPQGSTIRRVGRWSGALLLAAVMLAACADPRPGDSTRPPVPTAPVKATEQATQPAPPDPTQVFLAPERAYRAWLEALDARDPATACRLQHPERTIELRSEAIVVDRARLGDPCPEFVALLWEDLNRGFDIRRLETLRDTGEKASLAVAFDDSPTQLTVKLVFYRAAWRVRSEQPRTGEIGTADTSRWVEAWCDLDFTKSREEIVAAMGQPSGEYTVEDGGDPQLYWTSNEYDFRVIFDPASGAVLDLVGDYDDLSNADQARLACPELR